MHSMCSIVLLLLVIDWRAPFVEGTRHCALKQDELDLQGRYGTINYILSNALQHTNQMCKWRFTVNDGEVILIIVESLNMPKSEDMCVDYLVMPDGSQMCGRQSGRQQCLGFKSASQDCPLLEETCGRVGNWSSDPGITLMTGNSTRGQFNITYFKITCDTSTLMRDTLTTSSTTEIISHTIDRTIQSNIERTTNSNLKQSSSNMVLSTIVTRREVAVTTPETNLNDTKNDKLQQKNNSIVMIIAATVGFAMLVIIAILTTYFIRKCKHEKTRNSPEDHKGNQSPNEMKRVPVNNLAQTQQVRPYSYAAEGFDIETTANPSEEKDNHNYYECVLIDGTIATTAQYYEEVSKRDKQMIPSMNDTKNTRVDAVEHKKANIEDNFEKTSIQVDAATYVKGVDMGKSERTESINSINMIQKDGMKYLRKEAEIKNNGYNRDETTSDVDTTLQVDERNYVQIDMVDNLTGNFNTNDREKILLENTLYPACNDHQIDVESDTYNTLYQPTNGSVHERANR